ncbi:MAG: hypothetical protein HY560_08025 [Gemmatimonadetes bacterium]|nr:hypothetical protein [Gemmatimonadota bacterium]
MFLAALAACQQAPPREEMKMAAGPSSGTPEWKIQNAMSAAPEAIASAATIMDWPAQASGQPTQLRAGSNEFTCFPDMPDSKDANDPMCLDKVWLGWAAAWQGKKPFKTTIAGIAYMLQGGAAASETDPYQTSPKPGEAWVPDPPHLMLIDPDPKALASLPAKRSPGPWVMWKGTPYAHVMMPVK